MAFSRPFPTHPVTRPLARPVTTMTASQHRPNCGLFTATREPTVWGVAPDISVPHGGRGGWPR